ncbi:TetR family transcriptional regulator [Stackebrandtia endophytica]|uniref:TetR family transcriptional regulator n=2 Tax=Stackebrandtia endophytica TaxID=1496996 RepID=A0A543B178_9ACTN|nr:TetR family transcriptional regulator [Stackebrandtia endophytica]
MRDCGMARTKAQQRADTTTALLKQARKLFAARGYGDVGLTEIAEAAGVTKGALYHYFGSKQALFRAVVETIQQELGEKVARAADAADDPWDQFVAGCVEFLRAGSRPRVRRILLIDAPAVLGWNDWRAMDEAHSARHLREALASLIEAEILPPQPIEPITRLLSGAMNEAALWLADSRADLSEAVAALTDLLEGLRKS